jgi:hypothetical protein
MKRTPTGSSWALKKTMIPSTERKVKGTDINPVGRGSPPNVRAIPIANQ